MEIMEGILPSLSGISINLPATSFISGGPFRYFETLEEGSMPSVESDVSYALRQCFGVEVLSINMVHIEWLFVELVDVEIFNSNTNFACLLNMESVGDKSKIRMYEPQHITNSSLNFVSGIEDHFDPSNLSLVSKSMFQRPANLSLVENRDIDSSI